MGLFGAVFILVIIIFAIVGFRLIWRPAPGTRTRAAGYLSDGIADSQSDMFMAGGIVHTEPVLADPGAHIAADAAPGFPVDSACAGAIDAGANAAIGGAIGAADMGTGFADTGSSRS